MDDPSSWVYRNNIDGEPYDIAKHEAERVKFGFSTMDWWGFNSYLCFVIIGGLEKFRNDANGYPGEFKNIEEWNEVLDKMIAGFRMSERMRDDYDPNLYKSQKAIVDEGFALFAKYFDTLWD